MARMESDRATQVAIVVSGVTVMAIVAAGTSTCGSISLLRRKSWRSETYTTDTETGNRTKSDGSLWDIWSHARERTSERGHNDGSHEQKLTVPALEPGKSSVGEDSAECGGKRGWNTLETDLDWIVLEHVLE